jgi:predicted Zn-dependent protease
MLRCVPAFFRHGLILFLVLPLLGLAGCSSATDKANEFYRKGMALFEQGGKEDLIQADRAFRNALEIKKTLTPAIYGLALVAEKQGRLRESFSYLNQVVEQDPNHLEAQVKLGKMLLAAGQLESALEFSNKAQAINAENPGVQLLRAGVLLKQGDRPGAIGIAGKLLAGNAGNADALMFLAGERMDAGDFAKAVEYADRALAVKDDLVQALIVKAQALENQSKPGAAEEAMRRLVSLQPENAAFRNALVQLLVRHGRQDAAEAELRAKAERNPGDAQAKLEVVRFVQATRGLRAGLDELQAYVRKEPGNNELKFALAGLFLSQNEKASTEALLRSIMAEAGDSQDGIKARGLLAALLLDNGDRKSALALVDRILEKDRRNEQALIIKASLLLEEGRVDQAITDLRSILHETPDSARALMLLGKAHEMQGALELAEDHYSRAYQAGRLEPSYGLGYAEFLMRHGQSARAEKMLVEMIKPNPDSLPALRLLAQARSNQGNWPGAREVMDEVRRRGG